MEETREEEETSEIKASSSTSNTKKEEEKASGNSPTEDASCTGDTAEPTEKLQGEGQNKLSLITWNVDGLDREEQPERVQALCHYLTTFSPDVVFLQELIQPFVRLLDKCLAADYTFIKGGKERYFTGMFLKKSRITLLKSETVAYQTSHMLRNLLVATVLFKGQKLCLMTSHLESSKANAAERMRQLQLVMDRMSKEPDDVTVLFGGDTNLRDAELNEVDFPGSVCDVWEQLGKPGNCCYTRDTVANTNNSKQYKRFRFDRVYLRPAAADGVPQLEPDSMALVGLEKLRCGRFISDHWGIYCTFSADWTCRENTN
ncbi:hypothetical protein Q5P01_005918 [Channa striata]|uniref:Tyrosyl-DNA phosphodiesterase 2 n=1 Tax=Channa striata TaxID=64152 RepID=A0AA88SYZ3_CHASR|nr:hypothetical protein Q5P01_005918 [Channa striata]